MGGGFHRAPVDFLKRLRSVTGIEDLRLELNVEESDRRGGPVWGVWTLYRGEPYLICQWNHVLDGNLDGLASHIANLDYTKNGGRREYSKRIMDSLNGAEREKRRKFRDWSRGVADYSRDAFRKMAYGEG